MNFQEAAKKLNEIAGGKFSSLEYEVDQGRGIVIGISCSVYVSDVGYYKGPTWEDAFSKLLLAMNLTAPTLKTIEDIDPIPEIDIDNQ